jgi:hypothetical protein
MPLFAPCPTKYDKRSLTPTPTPLGGKTEKREDGLAWVKPDLTPGRARPCHRLPGVLKNSL